MYLQNIKTCYLFWALFYRIAIGHVHVKCSMTYLLSILYQSYNVNPLNKYSNSYQFCHFTFLNEYNFGYNFFIEIAYKFYFPPKTLIESVGISVFNQPIQPET